jgi:hypothetical protein
MHEKIHSSKFGQIDSIIEGSALNRDWIVWIGACMFHRGGEAGIKKRPPGLRQADPYRNRFSK